MWIVVGGCGWLWVVAYFSITQVFSQTDFVMLIRSLFLMTMTLTKIMIQRIVIDLFCAALVEGERRKILKILEKEGGTI